MIKKTSDLSEDFRRPPGGFPDTTSKNTDPLAENTELHAENVICHAEIVAGHRKT
jgi:hypothetical protein